MGRVSGIGVTSDAKCVLVGRPMGRRQLGRPRCRLVDNIVTDKVHTPTNALFIKFDKVSKFTLKITLTCSYMFRSTIIIREPSLEPS